MSNLLLKQKIGQLIFAGFPSLYFDDHLEMLIKEYNIGNIVFFSRNISSVWKTADLLYKIQTEMIKYNQVPAFTALDQEGGNVSRIRERALTFPCNMAFCAAAIPESTRKQGMFTGEKLKAIGFNMNIAPVMDVNNNPENPIIGTRSYGDDPEEVAKLGCAYIEGLQRKDVISVAKHFPGHGDTNIDTHLEIPTVHYKADRLEKIEFYPFKKAIEVGVDAIMTAHIVFPAFDKENLPATISTPVLTGLLRRKMGFNGLIITDCIEMKAVFDNFGVEKTTVEAIKAGADMICISHSLDLQIRGVEAIKNAVKSGELSESRIDESVSRILRLKEKYKLTQNQQPCAEKLDYQFSDQAPGFFAEEVSLKSITVIKNHKELLPIKNKNILSISAEPLMITNVEDGKTQFVSFSTSVAKSLGGESIVIPQNPDKAMIDEVCGRCLNKELIIFGAHNVKLNLGQSKLYKALRRINGNIVVVLLKNPYDILYLGDVDTCIAAYEYTPLSIASVIKVLKGEPAYGRLPVKL